MFYYKKYLLLFSLLFLFQGCSSLYNKQKTEYAINKSQFNKLPPQASAEYHKRIMPIIEKNLVFPEDARILSQEGKVIVHFEINTQKELNNLRIIQSSGFSKLDNQALKTIQNSLKNFPSPSHDVTIILTIKFILE